MTNHVSTLTLSDVYDQLHILEYIATNTPEGLTEGDRIFGAELEERKRLLLAAEAERTLVAYAVLIKRQQDLRGTPGTRLLIIHLLSGLGHFCEAINIDFAACVKTATRKGGAA